MLYLSDYIVSRKIKELIMLFCTFDIIILTDDKRLGSYYDIAPYDSFIKKETYFFKRNSDNSSYLHVSFSECTTYYSFGYLFEIFIDNEKLSLFVGTLDKYQNIDNNKLINIVQKRMFES